MRLPDTVSALSFRFVVGPPSVVLVMLSPELCTASDAVPAHVSDAAPAHVQVGDHDTYIEVIAAPYANHFELLQRIPVDFEEVEAGAVVAHFHEADLAVTGTDRRDAQASLESWILDIFDDLAAADPQTLGTTPAMQLRVLSRHLRRCA